MNVTAVNQVVASTQASDKTELSDGAAFSRELKKHLTHAEESEADQLTDDPSQSEVKSEGEEDTDKMEEASEFFIIPAFLRFDREIESSSTVLTAIHKDKLDMDSTLAQEVSKTPEASSEETVISMTDLSDSDLEAVTIKSSTESVLTATDSAKETAKLTPVSETKTALIDDSESMPVTDAKDSPNEATKEGNSANLFKALADVETEKLSIVKADGMIKTADASERVDVGSIKKTPAASENKLEKTLHQSTETNGQTERVTEVDSFNFQAGQFTEEPTETTVVEQSITVTDNPGEELLVQHFGLSQSAQLKAVPDAMSQATPVPVKTALEQSPEVIQDMMMSVSADKTGDTVYQSTLTLTPETLGNIKVELSYSGEKLTGNFIFETEDAKQYIESQWQQIKGPLETKGLQLNGFEFQVVDPNTPPQSGNLNFSQQSDQSKKDQQEERKGTTHSSERLEEETAGAKPVTRQESGLNYYA